jgi:dTDP-4-amino-4,6-dideoxygalactose transaminase
MTEMQAAMGICELERFDTWNMPRRKKNAHIIMDKVADLKQILYHPIDTKERENGWFVMAFTLDIENMNCNIKEFVDAVVAEGAPVWKVFWPQCHQELAYTNRNGFGKAGFPFNSKEYTDPKSLEFDKVEVPNAKWHEEHTFTCFAYPTYTPENCDQIGDALRKVILHFAK